MKPGRERLDPDRLVLLGTALLLLAGLVMAALGVMRDHTTVIIAASMVIMSASASLLFVTRRRTAVE